MPYYKAKSVTEVGCYITNLFTFGKISSLLLYTTPYIIFISLSTLTVDVKVSGVDSGMPPTLTATVRALGLSLYAIIIYKAFMVTLSILSILRTMNITV